MCSMDALNPTPLIKTPPIVRESLSQLSVFGGTGDPPPLSFSKKASNFIHNKQNQHTINYIVNGGASILNLFAFLNGNLKFMEGIQEKLEIFTDIYTKTACGIQGLIVAVKTFHTKNIIPLIGNALEIPTAIFSKGFDLWLFRGISQGLKQFYRIIDQREVVDKDGEPIKDKNGNTQVIGGNFSQRGCFKSFTTTIKETPKILSELIKKPANIKNLSHSLTLASVFQIGGALLALLGFKNIGATIRDTAGAGVDFALMTDKNKKNNSPSTYQSTTNIEKTPEKKGINFSSPFVQAGLTWILASVADWVKRLSFIENLLPNLTNLSLFSDRGASMWFTKGNLEIEQENLATANQ